jgi:4-diphosphocytidyl-2-C-methyl-D-erythritol kinase
MNNLTLNKSTILAPAKVNLNLYVKGLNQNGYHDLMSLVGFTEICDVVTIQRAQDTKLELSGSESHLIKHEVSNNIVLKAVKLVEEQQDTPCGVNIKLKKNIPVAAGLGGGSADAAAVINELGKMFRNKGVTGFENDVLATQLGSDVPVCLYGKGAWIEGYGSNIVPANRWPKAWLIVANPRVALATKDVFSKVTNYSKALPEKSRDLTTFSKFSDYLSRQRNDLTEAAVSVCPIINEVLKEIEKLPDCHLARMSGSGPSCFGLFQTKQNAENARNRLRQIRPEWWVKSTKLNFYAH